MLWYFQKMDKKNVLTTFLIFARTLFASSSNSNLHCCVATMGIATTRHYEEATVCLSITQLGKV